jgi:hypothetical protein
VFALLSETSSILVILCFFGIISGGGVGVCSGNLSSFFLNYLSLMALITLETDYVNKTGIFCSF